VVFPNEVYTVKRAAPNRPLKYQSTLLVAAADMATLIDER
jgi:hypothetical protein